MKKRKTYIYSGIILLFAMLAFSCSKEDSSTTTPHIQKSALTAMDKKFDNGIHGNEFVTSQLNSVMTHYNGMTNFANNSGNNNFTGSGSNGNSGTGSFTVHNISYPISFSGFESYGDGEFSIYFVDANNGLDYAEYGIGFNFLSPSQDEIASGTYYYGEEYIPYTFAWSVVAINIDTEFEEFYHFTSGSFTLTKSGNNILVNFNGVLDDGAGITGFYSGPVVDLEEEPEPAPIGTMSATIESQSWVAENVFADLDTQYGFLTITGSSYDGTTISMELNAEMLSAGVQLSIANYGVIFAYFSSLNGSYYANSDAIVNITAYTSSTISGTFEFTGVNYNNTPIIVHNGTFTNLTIN